jgi:hypothetical protein
MRIFHFQQTAAKSRFLKKVVFIALSFFILGFANSQTVIVRDTVQDFERLDPVMVSSSMDEAKIKEYQILKRRVIKTMPFAKMAAYKMKMMEDQLATIENKRERKKYIKKCENSLKAMYTEQLKKLTIGEGQVLMKLLHRETGKTSWEILKNYRGTAEAFFWQAFGTFWGHDLKSEFDPVVDYQIEHIIKIANLE